MHLKRQLIVIDEFAARCRDITNKLAMPISPIVKYRNRKTNKPRPPHESYLVLAIARTLI